MSIAALCVASLAAVTVVFVRGRRANETSLARAGAAPRSIAVLPFSDVSQKKDQEYFSTGMTDELIGALSAVSGLRVAARTSSYALANRASDPGEIGRRLHVDAILEGSVRKDGDHVRVVAELVSVMTGFPIWSQTFDKRLADVFVLQEDIAQAIVVAVRLQIADQRTIVQRATVDLGAYDAYLRGRLAWNKRTAASLVEADGWFRQAVDRDPKYARAWAGLADVHIIQALNFYAPAAENYEQGKAAALKALALDSTLAEAHTSLGAVQFLYDLDARAAEKSFQRAIALDPNYPAAHYFYAIFAGIGQPAVAEREAALAHALDPLSPPIAQGPGIVLIIQDKNAEAIAPLREAIALQPDYYFPHAWLAHALAATGKREEAVSEARRAVELAPDNTLVLAYLGEVYAMTGDRAKALAVVAQLDSLSKTRPVPGVFIARVYDNLGDTESALRWLDRAVASHEGQLTQLLWPGTFSHIAGDTRFQKLTRKLALTPVITAAPSGAHHAP